jgi:hypothetical protein
MAALEKDIRLIEIKTIHQNSQFRKINRELTSQGKYWQKTYLMKTYYRIYKEILQHNNKKTKQMIKI